MSNESFFATPEFESTASHVISAIVIPIHIFGAYCILFQTPTAMNSVKFSMFNLHFWSVLLDWATNILVCPCLLFPALAGFPLGILKEFNVPSAVQVYIVMSLFAAVGVSLISILENRYFLLFAHNRSWRFVRWPFLIFNYTLALTYFSVPYNLVPDQKSAVNIIKKTMIEISISLLNNPNLFVMALDLHWVVGSVLFVELIILNEAFGFGYLLVFNLEKSINKLTLSRQTLKFHKKFIRAIFMQILTPLLLMIFPLMYVGFSILFKFHNQGLNNISILILSLHGFCSTVIMLFLHEPYRRFCQSSWARKFQKKITNTEVYDLSSRNRVARAL